MATYECTTTVHKTLSGSGVDIIAFQKAGMSAIEVFNRSTDTNLWLTLGTTDNNPDAPTVAGDGVEVVPAGTTATFPVDYSDIDNLPVLKLIGSSNPYSIKAVA